MVSNITIVAYSAVRAPNRSLGSVTPRSALGRGYIIIPAVFRLRVFHDRGMIVVIVLRHGIFGLVR